MGANLLPLCCPFYSPFHFFLFPEMFINERLVRDWPGFAA